MLEKFLEHYKHIDMEIDLLPEHLKRKKTTAAQENLKRLIIGFVFLWLILAGLGLGLSLKIRDFKKQLSQIEADLKHNQPLLKEVDALLQNEKGLNEFLVFLKEHFKRDVLWSEKLVDLSKIVPEEIWFNEIYLRKEGKKDQENNFLDISAAVGYLKTDEEMLNQINNFMEQIKKNERFFKDFANLSLLDIKKAAGKEKFMDFKFTLFLKR